LLAIIPSIHAIAADFLEVASSSSSHIRGERIDTRGVCADRRTIVDATKVRGGVPRFPADSHFGTA
jgi:hypothetical protein